MELGSGSAVAGIRGSVLGGAQTVAGSGPINAHAGGALAVITALVVVLIVAEMVFEILEERKLLDAAGGSSRPPDPSAG